MSAPTVPPVPNIVSMLEDGEWDRATVKAWIEHPYVCHSEIALQIMRRLFADSEADRRRGEAPADLLRQLRRDIGTVESLLERPQQTDDIKAQRRMLQKWIIDIDAIEASLPSVPLPSSAAGATTHEQVPLRADGNAAVRKQEGVTSPEGENPAATSSAGACINCGQPFNGDALRYWFGYPSQQVGPLCEACDRIIKVHTRFRDENEPAAGVRPLPSSAERLDLEPIERGLDFLGQFDYPDCDVSMMKALGFGRALLAEVKRLRAGHGGVASDPEVAALFATMTSAQIMAAVRDFGQQHVGRVVPSLTLAEVRRLLLAFDQAHGRYPQHSYAGWTVWNYVAERAGGEGVDRDAWSTALTGGVASQEKP